VAGVKHYTELLNAHKIFKSIESRWIFYDAYMQSRDSAALLQSGDMPVKEGLLLFGFIQSWDTNFQGDLAKFLRIYKEIFPVLKKIEHKKIEDINLNGEVKDLIVEVFEKVARSSKVAKFESTDASKILHVLIPNFFVMWDRKIRAGLLGDSNKRYGKDYACEFLPMMQEEIKQCLNSYINEKGGDYSSASQEISRMSDSYPLTKLIDEYNYVRYTKGIKIDHLDKGLNNQPNNHLKQLENDFHKAMLDIYKNALQKCNYKAMHFFKMVNEMGGVSAAKKLLHTPGFQYGFEKLWECGCLHLTMEALILKEPWQKLFTEEEKEIARKRLRDCGYKL